MKLKTLIVSFMIAFAGIVNAQTATEILTKAQNQAKIENKNVFLIFHASWCGWCKKMEKNMDDPAVKQYFDANYVKTFITVQERAEKKNLDTPCGAEINEKFGGKNIGDGPFLHVGTCQLHFRDRGCFPRADASVGPASHRVLFATNAAICERT